MIRGPQHPGHMSQGRLASFEWHQHRLSQARPPGHRIDGRILGKATLHPYRHMVARALASNTEASKATVRNRQGFICFIPKAQPTVKTSSSRHKAATEFEEGREAILLARLLQQEKTRQDAQSYWGEVDKSKRRPMVQPRDARWAPILPVPPQISRK